MFGRCCHSVSLCHAGEPYSPYVESPTALAHKHSGNVERVRLLEISASRALRFVAVTFGLLFLTAGVLLCVIGFRSPSSVSQDTHTRIYGVLFTLGGCAMLFASSVMCLCRVRQRLCDKLSRQTSHDHTSTAAAGTHCAIHREERLCSQVLPVFLQDSATVKAAGLFSPDKSSVPTRKTAPRIPYVATRENMLLPSLSLLPTTLANYRCVKCGEEFQQRIKQSTRGSTLGDVASFPAPEDAV